jgi:hypothetical protein
MSKANVELRIERLVLHDLSASQRHRIAAMIEQELSRLLTERGVPPQLAARGESIPIDAASVTVAPNTRPDAIAAQVAQSIYSNLAGTKPTGSSGRS